jgi:hypothetical protein
MGSLTNRPPSDSPLLGIREATPLEREATFRLNGASWRGPLSIEQYLAREAHLGNQFLTREGGISYWILVDTTLPEDKRPILSSCETLKKRGWVAKAGKIEEVVTHGVGSVFCNPEYRGRGYAKRMMSELGKVLENGYQQKDETKKGLFSMLYSDIGKVSYYTPYNHHAPISPFPTNPLFT